MNSILDLDQLLDRILSLVEEVFDLHSCAVLLHDEERQALTIRAARGYRPEVVNTFRALPGQGVTGRVFQQGQALLVDDVTTWPGYVEGVAGARSEMAAPLRIGDSVIGVLDAESPRPSAFEEADLDLFRIFANQAATALRNARLLGQLEQRSRELERRVRELTLLEELGRQMNSNLDIDSLLQQVLQLARQALHFDHCAVLLKEEQDGQVFLRIRAALGYREEVVRGVQIRPGEGVTGRVLHTGRPLLVPDVKQNGSYIEGVAGGRCEMAAPLVVRDRIIGVIDAESTQPHAFGEDSLRLFTTFAAWAAVALHNADIHTRLERQQERLRQKVEQIDSMNRQLQEHAERIETTNRDLQHRLEELAMLQEASRVITSSLDLNKTLQAIASMTGEIIESSHCAIRLLDDERQRFLSDAAPAAAASEPLQVMRSRLSVPLQVGERIIGSFELASDREDAFGESARRVVQVLAAQAAIAIENARLFANTQETYYETIRSLAQALEARDAYTRGHSERVTRYALATAEALGLPARARRIIRYAGLLHDIGKIGISDSILNKSLSLTEQEWRAIRSHPLFGDTILEPLKFLSDAQHIVLHHHERWDGSGYPDGLRGEQIPIEARVVAVADAYDAMTSHRPYRRAMAHGQALAELRQAAGVQFDPRVVEAFLSVIERVRVVPAEP